MRYPFWFLLYFTAFLLKAQPEWISYAMRSQMFPPSEYFMGFTGQEYSRHDNLSEIEENLKEIARGNLSESILISITSTSESTLLNATDYSSEKFKKVSTSSSHLKASGLKSEFYADPGSMEAYAIAYIKKDKLIAVYREELRNQRKKIDEALEIANQFKDKGDAKTELRIYYHLLPYFKQVQSNQFILEAAGGTMDPELEKALSSLKLSVTDKIAGVLNQQYSLSDAMKIVATIFKEQVGKNAYTLKVLPVNYQDTDYFTAFSSLTKRMLEDQLKVSGFKITDNNSLYQLVGSYWDLNANFLTLNVSIVDVQESKFLSNVEVKIAKADLDKNGQQYLPKNVNVVARKDLQIDSGSGVNIELFTNKGNEDLLFSEGDSLKLSFLASRSGYVRIINHTVDNKEILLVDNYQVDRSLVNRIIELPFNWSSTCPCGVEQIEMTFSNEKFEELPVRDLGGGIKVIDREKIMSSQTRGFALLENGENLFAVDIITLTTVAR